MRSCGQLQERQPSYYTDASIQQRAPRALEPHSMTDSSQNGGLRNTLYRRLTRSGRRMTASASQPPDSQRPISTRIPGGNDAPARARTWVRSQLEGHIPATSASDAALLFSELVTNSVVHANVGAGRTLTLDVTTLDDRVRIAVTDPGSRLRPCMLPPDPETTGGLGLFLVDELCETWGVRQDLGPTCVWCELLLDQSSPSVVTTPAANAPTLRAVPAGCARPA